MRALRLLLLLALTGLVLLAAPASVAAQALATAQDSGEAKIVDFDFPANPHRRGRDQGDLDQHRRAAPHGHRPGRNLRHQADRPGASAEVTLSTPGTYFYFPAGSIRPR